MDEITKYYTIELKDFFENYKIYEGYYEIPFEVFSKEKKATPIQAKYQIDNIIKKSMEQKNAINPYFNYNYSKIIIKEIIGMRKSYYVEFPYMEREKYVDFLYDINNCLSRNSLFTVIINNLPNYGESAFIIECVDSEEDKVKDLINEYKLEYRYDRGLKEVLIEVGNKMWDVCTVPVGMDKRQLEEYFMSLFIFPSNEMLIKRGYKLRDYKKRNQIFISYSHKNKDIVRNFTEELQECGVNAFIDYKSIDYGENILESIMYGIEQSTLNIVFLSREYQKSMYGKTELLNIWDRFIRETANWIIVNLDGVNPNDIKPGLGGYKYFEWNNNSEELIEVVKRKIDSCK